ncbi:MAG: DUF3182 family protein [Caldimonas sp.]
MALRVPALSPHTRLTFLACRAGASEHEVSSHRGVARRLASLMECTFEEARDDAAPANGAAGYLVPNETIGTFEAARALGIQGEGDLFGGVVPHPFVATKTITHPLVGRDAAAPEGWCAEFAERVRDVVLPGTSTFALDDARAAGRRLLRDGPVRLKLASGAGGSGQSVARDQTQLEAQVAALDPAGLARHGLVIERNLAEVRTHSIGLIRLGSLVASYHGIQRTTRNRHGHEVYGGSSLEVVRCGLDELERMTADAAVRHAIGQARVYHAAALECFAGMYASRCNYDVAQGRDAAGRACSGVLEQSWRIGGASGAEVAALEALRDDPALDRVRASTVEAHGTGVAVPEGATLYYAGLDEHLGPITKYATLDRR